jgi:hypothetical protein
MLVVSVAIIEGPDAHVDPTANGKKVRYDGVRDEPAACPT